MTGSGTVSDPYMVMNIEDLYAIDSKSSALSYIKLGADIDFSGTEYAENFKTIMFKCRSFDGDGHAIRGIYVSDPTGAFIMFDNRSSNRTAYPTEIRNLTIEAEIIANTIKIFDYNYIFTADYQITNCCFVFNLTEGGVNNEAMLNDSLIELNFKYSTLIINTDLHAAHKLMTGGSFTGCQVRSNTVLRSSDSSVTENALWHNVAAADTGFFGSVELRYGGEAPGSVLWAYGGNHGNAYQVIEYKNISEALWNATVSTVCFYDSEKTGNAEVKNTVSEEQNLLIHGLTTEQCTNAEYLRSIGYVCEGEE